MVVLRELLPCPIPFGINDVDGKQSCRTVTRRHLRREGWQRWCNDGVRALNDMYGHGILTSEESHYNVSATQKICLDRLAVAYKSAGAAAPDCNSAAGAFRELCGTKPGYGSSDPFTTGERAPFREGDVSLPPPGARPADPELLFDGEDLQQWREWRTRLLHSPSSAQEQRDALAVSQPYSDAALTKNPKQYARFIEQLMAANACDLGTFKDATVGIFFVLKKGGAARRLRFIFDTRIANTQFREPPRTNLPSAGSWCRVEVPAGQTLYLSQSDVTDAFYRIRMPSGLSEMFVLPPVETKYLSLTDEQRATLGPRCSLRLCVLPMGWSWALRFCQRIVEAATRLAGRSDADAVTDRGPSQVFSEANASSVKHAEYVDIFAAISLDPEAARSAVARTKSVFESHGIGCHGLWGRTRSPRSQGSSSMDHEARSASLGREYGTSASVSSSRSG